MKAIDIFITTFQRQEFAKECVDYIFARTGHQVENHSFFRITIIDNGGNEWAETDGRIYRYVPLWKVFGNTGVHFAWNVAVSLAEGEYFITTDPDLLVPDLEPDWLLQLIKLMDERPDYGAISLCPHVFIGAAGIDPKDPQDVLERNMCGAVFRIMRTDAVKSVGGWDLRIEAGRNHEERTICGKLQGAGFKTGICSRLRAYHNFGENWGYPKYFTPEMQKHNPALKEYVLEFDKRKNYDSKTWLPK